MKQHPFTILVLEDDPNDVLLLRRALARNEIRDPVHVVGDGDEAIAYLTGYGDFANRTMFPFPRFILLDLKTPRKTGLEVLEWLSRNPELGHIPRIVLTSSENARDIECAHALGVSAYMVKPARFEEFQRMIKTIYDYWSFSADPRVPRTGLVKGSPSENEGYAPISLHSNPRQ